MQSRYNREAGGKWGPVQFPGQPVTIGWKLDLTPFSRIGSVRVLGIETSCDETGLAVYDSSAGLLAHALHSQVAMHHEYGGVVPELASRDHIRRVVPLTREVLAGASRELGDLDAIAYTEGPGLAGA